MRNNGIKKLVTTSLLVALMIVLDVTGLGIIPIPPAGVTIQHVPIIIGTLACGLLPGLLLGLEFGILSILSAYRTAMPLSVCFMNPLVAVLPRLMIPITVYFAAKLIKKGKPIVRAGVSAVVGSFTNTVLVLLALCVMYGETFAGALGVSRDSLIGGVLGMGAASGIPEAVVAAIITVAVDKALRAMKFYREKE